MAAWTGRRRWGVSVLVAGALIWAWATPARAQVTITQITDSGANFEPSISASGTRVTFRSFSNLANPPGCPVLPGNADLNGEAYLFDTGTGCFTQITNTIGGLLFNLKLSGDGTRVVFSSNRNLTNPGSCPPLPGNLDGDFEVFLFNLGTGCFTQVTNTTGAGSFSPVLNAAGTRVAFESQANLVNPPGCPVLAGNADGNIDIFLFDVGTGCFTQVTNTTGGGSGGSTLNAAGTLLAFASNRNLVNAPGCPVLPGNTPINVEIYLFDIGTGCLTQVTNTTGGFNDEPSLGAGTLLAFTSNRNLTNPGGCGPLPGNADGNIEIYLYNIVSGCLIQVTDTTGGQNRQPLLNLDTRVAFISNVDLANRPGCPALPGNADGNNEVYLFDLATTCFTQVTNTTPAVDIQVISINRLGTRIAFDADTNDSDSEIFLADVVVVAATAVPTLSEWAQLAMVTVLVLGGWLAVRRRVPGRASGTTG